MISVSVVGKMQYKELRMESFESYDTARDWAMEYLRQFQYGYVFAVMGIPSSDIVKYDEDVARSRFCGCDIRIEPQGSELG